MTERSWWWNTNNTEGGHDVQVTSGDLKIITEIEMFMHGMLNELPKFYLDYLTNNFAPSVETVGSTHNITIGKGVAIVNEHLYIHDSVDQMYSLNELNMDEHKMHIIALLCSKTGAFVKLMHYETGILTDPYNFDLPSIPSDPDGDYAIPVFIFFQMGTYPPMLSLNEDIQYRAVLSNYMRSFPQPDDSSSETWSLKWIQLKFPQDIPATKLLPDMVIPASKFMQRQITQSKFKYPEESTAIIPNGYIGDYDLNSGTTLTVYRTKSVRKIYGSIQMGYMAREMIDSSIFQDHFTFDFQMKNLGITGEDLITKDMINNKKYHLMWSFANTPSDIHEYIAHSKLFFDTTKPTYIHFTFEYTTARTYDRENSEDMIWFSTMWQKLALGHINFCLTF